MNSHDDTSFDCFDYLNPALRDFFANERQTNTTHSSSYQAEARKPVPTVRAPAPVQQQTSYSFGEEKFKELFSEEFDDDFYPLECSYLSRQGDLYTAPTGPVDDEVVRQQLLLLSTRADEELMHTEMYRGKTYGFGAAEPAKKPMLDHNRHEQNARNQLRSSTIRDTIAEHLQGFGERRVGSWEPPQEDQNRKRRLCRHFLKGHCKRGKACDFLHDSSIFCPDLQKVFLGGLPAHITETSLRNKLAEQGYTVINKPKVLRGFTPQVCLGSVEEAQRLIEKGKINIDGSLVDVRPYEAFAKDNLEKKLPDDIKRSVFLGGLATGTTGQMIKDDLEKMDVKVVNHPIIKTGFTPMVTVGTVEQAQMLVKLKKVLINDTLVDVRPYVNFRKRY